MTLFDGSQLPSRSTAERPPKSAPQLEVPLILALVLLGVVGALSVFNPLDVMWERPSMFAAIAAVSAIAMMAGSVVLIASADRYDVAELGLLGTGLLASSVLAAAHAAVTPNALYAANSAFASAAMLVIPVFVLTVLPVLAAESSFGRWAATRWRDWSLVTTLLAFILSFALVGAPNIWPTIAVRGPASVGLCLASLVGASMLTVRCHRLRRASGSTRSRVLWVALVGLSLSALTPLTNEFGLGFWGLRTIGLVSVLAIAVSGTLMARQASATKTAFAPVIAIDPFLTLDLHVNPVVEQFLRISGRPESGQLESGGTADLALKVAGRLQLTAEQRRNLGLAAVLHDIGKWRVPAEILAKPGSLTEAEFMLVQQHAADGAEMLAADDLLSPCAHIVRSHHERVDGAGYPDGLAGAAIPIESRIIAVCDAFDAMTHDREYRQGLPVGLALAILTTNSGQQWDADVVRHLMLVIADEQPPQLASVDEVTIPDDLADLLMQVDCEI